MLTTGAGARKRRSYLWVTFNCFSVNSSDYQKAISLQPLNLFRDGSHALQSTLKNKACNTSTYWVLALRAVGVPYKHDGRYGAQNNRCPEAHVNEIKDD